MKKIGLVLAGGGAKGAYQIGAMRAIHEMGLLQEITAYSGTSVGAINACLFAQNNVEEAYNLWTNLVTNDITINEKSYASVSFEEVFNKIAHTFDFDLLKTKDIFCTTTRIDNGMTESEAKAHFAINFLFGRPNEGTMVTYNLKNLAQESMLKILQASCAIPVIFNAVTIDHKLHFDGGLKNNLPYEVLLENGYENLIVIRLGETKMIKGAKNVIDVWPNAPISGTLNFSSTQIMENMTQGYHDTLAAIIAFNEQRIAA